MIQRQSDRAFGFTFAGVFLTLFVGAWAFFGARLWWALPVSGAFAIVALCYPVALLPLNRLWARVAHGIGQITNRLLLGLVFFGLILPLGLLMRALGKDPVARRFDRGAQTYLQPVERHTDAKTLADPF